MQKKKKTYLYLARRDKKAVKILSVFNQSKDNFLATRIQDIDSLQLSEQISKELKEIQYENRMMWEVFLECAEDYDVLKTNLKKKGYKIIPRHCDPMITITMNRDKEHNNTVQKLNKKNIMLRRKN